MLRISSRITPNNCILGNVGNRSQLLQAAASNSFGPLPLPSMINALQSSKLRKHLLVRLNDLLSTQAGWLPLSLVNLA